jgi:tetratricopeptide (TPR) repeat protein
LKLHQQVARALETQYADRIEEHAAELAEHFSQSTDPADLKKAVEYGEMAANRSLDVYAYGEAVRLLEQALKVQKVLDPADKAKICDLLLDLASALTLGGEAKRALEIELEEAFSLAQSIDDEIRASRTCEKAILDMMYTSDISLERLSGPELARWVERADRYARPDTITRVMANQGKAISKYIAGLSTGKPGLVKESVKSFIDNVELSRRIKDPEILWIVACSVFIFVSGPRHMRERQLLAEELAGQPRAGITTRILGTGLLMVAYVLLESGQRQLAGDIYHECREIIERSEQTNLWFMTTALKGMLDTIDGRLEEADEAGRQIHARGQELDFINYAAMQEHYGCSSARVWLGKTDEIISLIGNFANIEILGGSLLTINKSHAEIIEYLDRTVVARPGIGTPDDETLAALDVSNLEVAVLVRHHKAAELLLERLKEAKSFFTVLGYLTCTARNLGGAAALLGRYDEARKYYQEAIKVCTEMRFRPELALSRLQLAELLLEHYPNEKKEALEHLDFAIKEFREMKMRPSLERALRHKDILKA